MSLKDLYFAPIFLTLLDWYFYLLTGIPSFLLIIACILNLNSPLNYKYFFAFSFIFFITIIYLVLRGRFDEGFYSYVKSILNYSLVFYYSFGLISYFKHKGTSTFFWFNKYLLSINIIIYLAYVIFDFHNEVLFQRSYTGNFDRLKFPFLEPSFLSIYCGILYFAYKNERKSNAFLFWIIVINGVLSQSPAFILLAVLSEILFLNRSSFRFEGFLIFGLIGFFSMAYVVPRLINIYYEGYDFGGGMERVSSISASWELFQKEGYLGLGIGQNYLWMEDYYQDQWKTLLDVKTNGDSFILTLANELGLFLLIIFTYFLSQLMTIRALAILVIIGFLTGYFADPKVSLIIAFGHFYKIKI